MKKFNLLIIQILFAVFFIACDAEVKDNMPDEGSLVGTWTITSVKGYSNETCDGDGTPVSGASGSVSYTATEVTVNMSNAISLSYFCVSQGGSWVNTESPNACYFNYDFDNPIYGDIWIEICEATEEGGLGGNINSSDECEIPDNGVFTYTYDASSGAYCETDSLSNQECGTLQVNGNQASITWPDSEDGSCMKYTMVYDLQ